MKATESSPRVQAMTADGVVYHVAGASEAQELACMLATLVAYLRAAEHAGISPAEALPKINVALAADIDEFSTIAKLRAARRLIWRVADASGAGEAAASVQLNCPTSYRMMAKRDPWTNILRTTIACTGAALGGADAIVVLPFTFALGKPRRLRAARRPQHSNRLPGGKQSRPRHRSGGRVVVRRESHRRHGEKSLGDFPGHRERAAACWLHCTSGTFKT